MYIVKLTTYMQTFATDWQKHVVNVPERLFYGFI